MLRFSFLNLPNRCLPLTQEPHHPSASARLLEIRGSIVPYHYLLRPPGFFRPRGWRSARIYIGHCAHIFALGFRARHVFRPFPECWRLPVLHNQFYVRCGLPNRGAGFQCGPCFPVCVCCAEQSIGYGVLGYYAVVAGASTCYDKEAS